MTTTDRGSRQQYTGPQVPGRRTAASRQRARAHKARDIVHPGHRARARARATRPPGHGHRRFEVKPDDERSARHHSPNDYMLAAIHPPRHPPKHRPTPLPDPPHAHCHSPTAPCSPKHRPTPPRPPHAHCTTRRNPARYLAPDRVPGHRTPDTVRPTHWTPGIRRGSKARAATTQGARQMAGRRAARHGRPSTDGQGPTLWPRVPAKSVVLSIRH
jgi:hypothetical protein